MAAELMNISTPRIEMSVFIDTGAFLAYRNKEDRYHEIACKLFTEALKGKYGQMYTSDYVYDETLTLALVRTNNSESPRSVVPQSHTDSIMEGVD